MDPWMCFLHGNRWEGRINEDPTSPPTTHFINHYDIGLILARPISVCMALSAILATLVQDTTQRNATALMSRVVKVHSGQCSGAQVQAGACVSYAT